ncbi:GntR family transcriptional regulator [Nonomuraea rhizosphaerae]|uniref:GntR family transcriptional regulator n=1 Tax=Nonomuraea rhizosphaerae TaxID=2665663 RepID=UPI001C5E1480|nr:GntR family transcriptional regulator [Nonomuraea rhizosphaerae]
MTTSLYRALADDLRKSIYWGELTPGTRLPTETELQDKYGVSRNTVRLALGLLINEGLIFTKARQGTYVRDQRPMRIMLHDDITPAQAATPEYDAFTVEMMREGRDPRQVIEVHVVHPPVELATRLELGEEVLAAVRRRLKYVDGEPYMINDSYFPLELVQSSEIMDPTPIPRGANEVLRELGHLQRTLEDEIISRMPTIEESSRMNIRPGTPVTVHIRTGREDGGLPVRVAVTVVPGDKGILLYKIEQPCQT